jgi:hypothetical protein
VDVCRQRHLRHRLLRWRVLDLVRGGRVHGRLLRRRLQHVLSERRHVQRAVLGGRLSLGLRHKVDLCCRLLRRWVLIAVRPRCVLQLVRLQRRSVRVHGRWLPAVVRLRC